ncbi:hypothetical protein DL95DRAFT_26677 [Leptodontidium sp. 2 PMI_412]|nr:hypothetical protein DL95DRAFT_26677 [Leptodontidium sp. 2 PMI_412]
MSRIEGHLHRLRKYVRGSPRPTSQSLDKFPLFRLLPPEIRVQIWRQTPTLSLIYTKKSQHHDPYRTRFLRSPNPIPPTLHACREARFSLLYQPGIVGKNYTYRLHRMGLASHSFLYICLELDTLVLTLDNMKICPIPVRDMRCMGRDVLLAIPATVVDYSLLGIRHLALLQRQGDASAWEQMLWRTLPNFRRLDSLMVVKGEMAGLEWAIQRGESEEERLSRLKAEMGQLGERFPDFRIPEVNIEGWGRL